MTFPKVAQQSGTYWLTRIAFLRCLCFVYSIAFLVALTQNSSLIGESGLMPATTYMKILKDENARKTEPTSPFFQEVVGFMSKPTLFWFIEPTTSNLDTFAMLGLLLSCFVVFVGTANSLIMFFLWILYFSIDNVGQTWYAFGWESQLLETGFLAIFLVPFFSLRQLPPYSPTPHVCIWGYIWLLFRIMIGAGLIKIRGDECWRNLTCMDYHYQTQPVPNPLSPMFHFNPSLFHRIETMGNHIVELLCPWLLLMPRPFRLVGGTIQILFQGILIASGNLSFLNWLTALPAIFCFDDLSLFSLGFFSKSDYISACKAQKTYDAAFMLKNLEEYIASKEGNMKADHAESSSHTNNKSTSPLAKTEKLKKRHTFQWDIDDNSLETDTSSQKPLLDVDDDEADEPTTPVSMRIYVWFKLCIGCGLFGLLSYSSFPVVLNLLSVQQGMNVSFSSWKIVNSYGAFGSITKVRHEVILQGTTDKEITPSTKWKDFNFNCKPGDISRRPCIISPFHYRLDWLMWFAAFQNYQQSPWLINLSYKLLDNDTIADSLLSPHNGNPFRETNEVPAFVRAELYEYEFAKRNQNNQQEKGKGAEWETGVWWRRRRVREYHPPLEKKNPSVLQFLNAHRMLPNS